MNHHWLLLSFLCAIAYTIVLHCSFRKEDVPTLFDDEILADVEEHQIYKPVSFTPLKSDRFPSEVDWRNIIGEENLVAVKSQGYCGSCYAFGSLAAVEITYKTRYGETICLSEQEIIDCNWRTNGCNGGFPEGVLVYIALHGLSLSRNYPNDLESDIAGSCMKSKNWNGTFNPFPSNISDSYELRKEWERMQRIRHLRYTYLDGEEDIKTWLVMQGPVLVSVFMNVFDTWYNYDGTSYVLNKAPYFPGQEIDGHAFLIVGYGSTPEGKQYWIMRNSWGSDWGINGYGYYARGNESRGIMDAIGVYFEDDPMEWTREAVHKDYRGLFLVALAFMWLRAEYLRGQKVQKKRYMRNVLLRTLLRGALLRKAKAMAAGKRKNLKLNISSFRH